MPGPERYAFTSSRWFCVALANDLAAIAPGQEEGPRAGKL